MTGRHRRSRQTPARLALAAALALLAGAVFASRGSVPTAPPAPAATDSVLSVREECQQALTYPGRTSADRTWLQRCVHALATPTVGPTISPTVGPTPSPTPTVTTPAPSPTVGPSPTPTTPPPSPSPSPGDEWMVLRAQAGPDIPLQPMVCPGAGYISLNTAGAVFEGWELTNCGIAINATNVTVRNVRLVDMVVPEFTAIHLGDNARNVAITDVEVVGKDRAWQSVQYAVYLRDAANVTITRANFHQCADCVQGEHVVMRDSWIHHMANIPGISHVDGFQCNSNCDGTLIEHNLIDLSDVDQTGAVSLFQDFGVPRNVLVTRNWLLGGGWTIYGGAGTKGTPTNIRIVDNIVDRGQFGWLAYWNPNGAGNQCSGNRSSADVALIC